MGEPVRIIDLARNMIGSPATSPTRRSRSRSSACARGEDPRGALQRRRALAADVNRADRAGGAGEALDPGWVEETIERLESLVASGDEAGLAEHVVELMGTEGAAGRTLVLIPRSLATMGDPDPRAGDCAD